MKKKNFTSTITTRLLLLFIVLVGAVVWCRMFTANFLLPKLGENNMLVKVVMYGADYSDNNKESSSATDTSSNEISVIKKSYPFSDDSIESIVAPKTESKTNTWSDLDNKFRKEWSGFSNIADDFSSKYLPLYKTITKTSNKIKSVVGWNIPAPNTYNPVVTLDDGYLALCNSRFDYETAEKSLASFKSFADEQNTPFLYVAAPSKINTNDKEVYGIIDYSNQNTQGLLALAEKDNINCYDLSSPIDKKYPNRHDAYYITDLHWKSETGLYVAKCLTNRLNNDFGLNISNDLLEPENFYAKKYKDGLLGSQGRKLTLSVANPEDISFWYPKYKTDISVTIPTISFDKRGDFSLLYNQQLLDKIENGNPDYDKYDPYGAFMRGGNALTRVVNHNASNDLKVLIVYDSFGRTVAPYLSQCFAEMDTIDLRRFDGSLETFIKKEGKYDAIIVLYSPGAMSLASEGQELFDFR